MATLGPAATITPARAWWLAARPRTLPVAVAPVVVGTAVAAAEGSARFLPGLAALVGALLLQIISNLANDVFDHEQGADGDDRLGPPRACQMGWLTPSQMRRGIALAVLLAVLVGSYLVSVAGWPVLVAGVAGILAALAYTGGPWPFGYKGLGDIAVFVFFGVVAVVGTYYVQTLRWSWAPLVASFGVGAMATAILVVNNIRDIDTDRSAGKNTLAVRLGLRGARCEYLLLLALAYLLLPLYSRLPDCSSAVLLPLLSLPMAVKCLRVVLTSRDGETLNAALAGTAQLTLLYSLLLSLGWCW